MSEAVITLCLVLAAGNAMGLVAVLISRSELKAESDRMFEQWSNELLKRGHAVDDLCRLLVEREARDD